MAVAYAAKRPVARSTRSPCSVKSSLGPEPSSTASTLLPFEPGAFHRLDHLDRWKTLPPCEKDARSVVADLRSRRPTYLAQIGDQALPPAA